MKRCSQGNTCRTQSSRDGQMGQGEKRERRGGLDYGEEGKGWIITVWEARAAMAM